MVTHEEPMQTPEHRSTSDDLPFENVSTEPNGVYHKLKRGQTLSSLSRSYQVPLDTLMRANRISDPKKIRAGASLFIPRPSEPVSPQVKDIGALSWPLQGRITGKFGPRGRSRLHEGIDIDGHGGDEIRAAAAGTVVHAGTRGKYGRMVLLDHGDGLQTLYAHVGKLMVRIGDRIERSDPIAEVGRSGNATGTHLHFEVHHSGQPVDPMRYLQPDVLVSSQP
jgi:murein DD-endopeptidase MepM/ murein hydrolase activator NlpD